MPKRLILSVVSSQRDSLGANYTHTFSDGAGNIGRDETCEWTLPDSAVSRRHAGVRLLNGTFFIEDFSTNGTYVGGTDEAHRLVKNQPRPLRSGDQILIGEYQIVVSLEDAAADAARAGQSTAMEMPQPAPSHDTPITDPGRSAPLTPTPGGEVDPLKLLGAAPGPSGRRDGADPRPLAEMQPGSGLDEPMPPLSPVAPLSPGSGQNSAGGGQIPADWWKQPAAPGPPSGDPAPELPRVSPPGPPPAAPLPPARAHGADDDSLVRDLVAGLMDVLGARAEIKRRFRVSMTMIQARENNPLKFAVDTDEAMSKLFGGGGTGYLGASEAFDEAFRDLKAHQLAMLAGMREAFNKMLKQFDPHRLEARFEKTVGKGKLPFMKDRHWELYKELYDELTADAEDSFHRLFGNAFAAAYEQEMQKLIHSFKRGG